jgi:hypothetical protein
MCLKQDSNMVNLESSFACGAVTRLRLTHWYDMRQSDVVYTFQMLFNMQHMPMTDTSCLQLENFAHVPVQSDGLAL